MKFKDARQAARELALETHKSWVYMYRTKNKKESEYEISSIKNFNSTYWFYVSSSGAIMNAETYEKIIKRVKKEGLEPGVFPFSKKLYYYGRKWNMIN